MVSREAVGDKALAADNRTDEGRWTQPVSPPGGIWLSRDTKPLCSEAKGQPIFLIGPKELSKNCTC